MALGAMFAFVNSQRHWEMHKLQKAGEWRRISGTPFATSFFFFFGWWIAPPTFTPWLLLVPLAELPAFITIVPGDEEEGASPESAADVDAEERSDPTG
jgi:hypothetical protein